MLTYENRTDKYLSKNDKASAKLKQALQALSHQREAATEITNFHRGDNFVIRVVCPRFEDLNVDLLQEMLQLLKTAPGDSRFKKPHINDILLDGGLNHIRTPGELFHGFCGGREPLARVDPRVVRLGAAIQAAALSNQNFMDRRVLRNVTFEIDANGILPVTAKDIATHKQKLITISEPQNRLTVKYCF
jgi:molecular chaperone DnaK (HSP70)